MQRLSEQTAYYFFNESPSQSILLDIHLLLDAQTAAKRPFSIFSYKRACALFGPSPSKWLSMAFFSQVKLHWASCKVHFQFSIEQHCRHRAYYHVLDRFYVLLLYSMQVPGFSLFFGSFKSASLVMLCPCNWDELRHFR